MRQLALLAIACMGALGCHAGQTNGLRAENGRVLSRRYGFSISPPRGWTAGVDEKDLPVLINFPPTSASAQQVLPKGGAVINFVAKDSLPGRRLRTVTLPEWARFDEHLADPATVSASAFDMPPATGASNALVASFDVRTFSPDEQRQHEASVYWKFQGKEFAAHLFYVIGDPRAREYEALLAKLVRGVRPLWGR
jgi:hypothetical protein